jgi:NADH-quinone oxidoreductase subunit J
MISTMAQVYFYACALLAIAGAVTTVVNPNPIRGAMGLLLMIVSVAGLFLALHAQFLAAIQLIVYAGAIVVLFIFVIMLLGPSAMTPRDHRGRIPRVIGAALFGLCAIATMALITHGGQERWLRRVDENFGGIDSFGSVLFTYGIVPFELSSALLMVAVIGAVAVARGREVTAKQKAGGPLGPETVTARTMGTPIPEERLPGTAADPNPAHGGH